MVAEVDLFRQSHLLHVVAGEAFGRFEAEGVKIVFIVLFETVFGCFGSQHASQHVNLGGFVAQTFGTVPHGIETGHDGGEGAGGADVGSGFLALDVLLAHLEGHTHGTAAFSVNGETDDTTGHLALELLGAGVEAGGRRAEAHRDAKTLGGTSHAVGTPFTGRCEEREGVQVGGNAHENLKFVALGGESGEIMDAAPVVGVLDHRAEEGLIEFHLVGLANDKFDALSGRVGLHHADAVREHAFGNEIFVHVVLLLLAGAAAVEHQHHLAGGGGIVEHGGVGQRHGGERRNHRLVVEEGFNTALRNLGLIGGVGGVPAGVLEHVAQNHGRGIGVVMAHSDEGTVHFVLGHLGVDEVEVFALLHPFGQVERLRQADGCRHGLLNQFVH